MENKNKFLPILLCSVFLSACSKMDTTSSQIAEDTGKLACSSFSSVLHKTLANALIDGNDLPRVSDLRATLEKRAFANVESPTREQLINQVTELYSTLTEETKSKLQTTDRGQLLEALTALDIGDRSTPERDELTGKIQTQYARIAQAAQDANLDCGEAPEEETPIAKEPTPMATAPVLSGAIRVMTNAYQNCSPIDLNEVTSSTPNTKGITVTGKHSDGIGSKRMVTDIAALQKTHYYIREGLANGSGCFNVPAKPLIYDYGGKPYARAETDAPLDFFKEAGSGTSVLGMDCSGYVFSALAVSGLRLAPGKRLTASQVYGVSARMYMNPQSNGLSCMSAWNPSSSAPTIRDGDILASTGHVVILEVTGNDPLGLSRANNVSECTASKLSHKGFAFNVWQSAPVKEGMGMNRMRAADYLDDSASMRSAMVEYAVSACKVKYGKAANSLPSTARIARHKLTSECRDRQVSMERESCVRSCTSHLRLGQAE